MAYREHTKGPWRVGHYSSVVGLPIMAQPEPTRNSVSVCVVHGDREQAEANAQLIGAATDMLTALREMVSSAEAIVAFVRSPPVLGNEWDAKHAALVERQAKAMTAARAAIAAAEADA